MPDITAIIITKNEAANIKRCLDSVAAVANEIIVIDSGSEDETMAIVEAFPARFISTEWKGYTATKNFGNELASHDWILSLDADEELSEGLQKSILTLELDTSKAYVFNRLNNYYGKFLRWGGFYPDRKVRLFGKKTARWIGDGVHETLELSKGISSQWLDGDLLHYTYSNLTDHRERQDRYARIAAKDLAKRSGWKLRLKGWSSPIWRFMSSYFFRLGFMGGKEGFIACKMHARDGWLKCRYALQIKKDHRKV